MSNQWHPEGGSGGLPSDMLTSFEIGQRRLKTSSRSEIAELIEDGLAYGFSGSIGFMIYFKATPSAANQSVDIWLDIGGTIGELYRQTFSLPRGAGVERGILYALPSAYTLGTREANGATVYINSDANMDIHTINFNFDRTHKAR